MNLLPADFQDRLERHLDRRLGELLEDAPAVLDSGLGPVAKAIRHFVLAGGKRIRPQLLIWTCERCGGHAKTTAVLDAACAWELFHAFLLVHDDIIDAADLRRDRPSLHRTLAQLDGDTAIFGTNLGIVAGDLLFAAAMRLWHGIADSEIGLADFRRLLPIFSRVAFETGVGQVTDITLSHARLSTVTESQILHGYHGKTAAYTFEGPMVSGAILAGADEETVQCLSRFAAALGQAYQLQNDLIDLASPMHESSDLAQQKRTVTLVRGRHLCPVEELFAFDQDVALVASANREMRFHAAGRLRKRLYASGAVDATRGLVNDLLGEARRQACELSNAPSSDLIELLSALEEGYFASPVG